MRFRTKYDGCQVTSKAPSVAISIKKPRKFNQHPELVALATKESNVLNGLLCSIRKRTDT